MSRESVIGGTEYTPNPASKFLYVKNNYDKKTMKDDDGEDIEVLKHKNMCLEFQDKENDYERVQINLPFEFVVLNPNLVTFKGKVWANDKCTNYYSNEIDSVKGKDSLITIKTKEGEVMSFTLNQLQEKLAGEKTSSPEATIIKDKLKGLGIDRYNSVYVAVKNDDNEFEIVNLQLKGQSLSGITSKKPNPKTGKYDVLYEGFWAFRKKAGNALLKNYVNINDFYTAKMESGTKYGLPNFTVGEYISEEDGKTVDALFDTLESYHTEYFKRSTKELVEVETEELSDDLPE